MGNKKGEAAAAATANARRVPSHLLYRSKDEERGEGAMPYRAMPPTFLRSHPLFIISFYLFFSLSQITKLTEELHRSNNSNKKSY
jgi:hypothetical protein